MHWFDGYFKCEIWLNWESSLTNGGFIEQKHALTALIKIKSSSKEAVK